MAHTAAELLRAGRARRYVTIHHAVSVGGHLTDVAGVRVGHSARTSRGWRTGTTVILLPPDATAGVDVRGGGPGTRETDLLSPLATIATAHAICLTGGSAYGLAAAQGVMHVLEARGIGFCVGTDPAAVVPLVPAAVIFDLGRGGVFGNRPDESFGRRAANAARAGTVAQGSVGAGTGARSRGLQGGVGTASITLPDGVVVSALAVVNSAGSIFDPATGLPWEAGSVPLRRPPAAERDALRHVLESAVPALNTTIGVVATNVHLNKAQCCKFASVAHDGLARAIRPVHSLFDGDTIFGVATGTHELPGDQRDNTARLNAVLEAGAQCFAVACTNAVVHATRVGTNGLPAYRDLCPGAFAR
jgi:L-aminopeptidase/D-esterase-like protein